MPSDLEVRDRLLVRARDRFLQSGFSKVTLDELAGELGISKKTLYKFFPSKENLLRAAIHMTMRGVEKNLDRIVSSDKTFADKLAEILMMIGRVVGRLGRPAQADLQRFAPDLWKELEEFRRVKVLTKIGAMILQAKKEGIIREDVNADVLVLMLLQSVQGIVTPDVLLQNSFSASEAFRTIFRVLFEGSLTDEARKDFHVFDEPISQPYTP